MYRFALAAAIAAAIAAAVAVQMYGTAEPDTEVAGLPTDTSVNQLVETAMLDAMGADASSGSAQLIAMSPSDADAALGGKRLGALADSTARPVCDETIAEAGLGQSGPVDLLETGKTCVVSGNLDVFEPSSSHALYAELSAEESLAVRRDANRIIGLRSRQGAALGPADTAFELLKSGNTPPASSSAKSTSDYTP